MIQRRQHWRLARESCHAASILRESFGRNLDGNIAIQLGIGGAPDLAHAALAELGGDAELGNLVDSSKAQARRIQLCIRAFIYIAALYRQTSCASP
jgi:hypothetical protein